MKVSGIILTLLPSGNLSFKMMSAPYSQYIKQQGKGSWLDFYSSMFRYMILGSATMVAQWLLHLPDQAVVQNQSSGVVGCIFETVQLCGSPNLKLCLLSCLGWRMVFVVHICRSNMYQVNFCKLVRMKSDEAWECHLTTLCSGLEYVKALYFTCRWQYLS